MRVLLAAAPHADTFGYAMPPPGLLRLGGALSGRGHEVLLEDLPHRLATGELAEDEELPERAAQWLLRRQPDLIGLSVMGATVPIAVLIAQVLARRSPDTPILFGGPGTMGIDEALIERFRSIDAVVRGEGELTLPEVLERLGSVGRAQPDLEGIRGVTWRAPNGLARREPDRPQLTDLSELPDSAWHLVPPFEAYRALQEDLALVPVDSGRGCVYDCSFCTIGRTWSRRSRTLPAKRLVEEVRAVGRRGPDACAYLCHDIFGADRAHALEFCTAMAREASPVPWECRARVDHLDEELVARMGEAGCYRVLLGIESADAGVRRTNQKGMADDVDVLSVVASCDGAGITPILSFILGLPGEGDVELEATLELALGASLTAGVHLSFHLVNPQPGCALGEEFGADSRALAGIAPDMALGAGRTDRERELIAAHPDLFSSFALLTALEGGETRLRFLAELAGTLPEVLMRCPRTFALVARSRGAGVLDTWQRWRASDHPLTERGFDSFASDAGNELAQDMLRWESALARQALPSPHDAVHAPELLETRFDLPRVAADLRAGTFSSSAPSMYRAPGHLAIVRGTRGVRTLSISEHVATIARLAGDGLDEHELEARLPGAVRALPELRRRGLIPNRP